MLVRFGRELETLFGLTREVLLLYSPHRDLQMRTFAAVPSVMADLPREVTPRITLIASPDPRASVKLADWSGLNLLAIPIPYGMPDPDDGARELLRELQKHLFQRDAYAETAPVHGTNFFGRRAQLQSVLDDVAHQRVAGVFGLRKSGKTSLLYQLRDEIARSDALEHVFVLCDLEDMPSFPKPVVGPLVESLRDRLLDEFRARKIRTKELADLDSDQPRDFKRALQTLLKKTEADGLQLVIALDEVEYLCPPDKVDLEFPEAQEVAQFFGVLRSLVQESRNFVFLIAGLASATIEAGRLFGRHNPLYAWAKPYYLPPFSIDESDELLRTLGSTMGVTWDERATRTVFDESGGHPFLLRDLASTVVTQMPLDAARRMVTRSDVTRTLGPWRRRTAANIKEILAHVGRYYPSEQILLEILLEDPAGFSDLVRDEQTSVYHLIQLGLILEPTPGAFVPSTLVSRSES